MKNKQEHFNRGIFALLFFVILGYTVTFYPEQLSVLDIDFQAWLRGDFPSVQTTFYRGITVLGNSPVIISYTAILGAFFYYQKRWKAEGLFLIGNLLILGLASTLFKLAYHRLRPDLPYLIADPIGYSFPSWHAAASLTFGLSLAIILGQRWPKTWATRLGQIALVVLAVIIGVSRIYLGVHYPTDVIAGWLLSLAVTSLLFPIYDQKRFEWRFTSKQK